MAFKICVIGCGNMSYSIHGPAIKRYEDLNEDVRFTACCDLDEGRALAFKERFGLDHFYTDIDNMLDTERPAAVCLISPVDKTAELTCKIFEKGYPLILEKPPGMNVEETRRMIEAGGNIPNQVAFNRRYMPLVLKAMELIDTWGGTGCILDINYRMLRFKRVDADFSTTAIHGIDLVKHVAQADYRHIDFKYRDLPQHGKTVANFHLNCEMENGIFAHLDFLPVTGINTERMEINTTQGLLVLHLPIWAGCYDAPGQLIHYANNEIVLTVSGEDLSGSSEDFMLAGFYDENARFFDDVRNGKKPEGDIATGLQSVEVAHYISRRQLVYR